MQFETMDETLVEINKIENISSIKFYYIRNVIPTLMVTYGDGKMLNLTSKDKYFIQLVKKVREVYNIEKNIHIAGIDSPFRKNKIDIDEISAEIIEKGSLEKINELYSFYTDKISYNESLLFQMDEFKNLLFIAKYHIVELFSKTNITVSFNDEFTGYRNNYILTGKVDGIFKTFKVTFNNIEDNQYELNVSGILPKCSSLNIKIKFKKDKIEVETNIPSYNLYGCFTYLPCENDVKKITEIVKNNLPIYFDKTSLEETKNTIEDEKFKWFKLPWNAYYGINNFKEKIGSSGNIITNHNLYVQRNNDSCIKKEHYSKCYVNNTGGLVADEVVMDEEVKNITCIPLEDDIYVIETKFLSSKGDEGYYDEKLNNKYFYHVVRSKDGIKSIIRDNSKCINKDEINNKGDLLNRVRVLSILGGNK